MIKINYEAISDLQSIIAQVKLIDKRPLTSSYKVITNFEEAYKYAFIRSDYELNNEVGYTWADIKSKMFSYVKQVIYQENDYKQINEALSHITIPELEDLEINKFEDQIMDEVYSDFMLCTETRAIIGKDNKFFEDLLSAYQMGGWPCGWEGNYPDGKLIVYFLD